MKKYIIVSQSVYDDGVDDIRINRFPVYDSIVDANNQLIELHKKYYSEYDTKILHNDYLFIYSGIHIGDKYKYTLRFYYRIMEIDI